MTDTCAPSGRAPRGVGRETVTCHADMGSHRRPRMLRKPLLSLLLSASVLSSACSDSDSDDEQKPDPAVLIIDRDAVDFGELEVGQVSPEHLFTVRNASPSAVE